MKRISILGLLSFFFVFLLVFHTLRDFEKYTNYLKLSQSSQVLEETLEELRSKNAELKEEIEKIRNSKNYARKVLRERYHLTEDDEKIIFFSE